MATNVGATRDGEPVSEINTTPLIDVMLVLLIMLIVTLPPQRHAVKLDTPLPCNDCPANDNQPPPVTVAIDYRGAISWDGREVSRADLRRRFAEEARRPQQAEFHIRPDSDTEYAVVAHVLASAQREGIHRLGVLSN